MIGAGELDLFELVDTPGAAFATLERTLVPVPKTGTLAFARRRTWDSSNGPKAL
jgi:hypothetical protein